MHLDVARPVTGGDQALRLDRSEQRRAGAREGEEQPVAGRVDLGPIVLRERRPEDPVMFGQQAAVTVAEGLEEGGGSLDIGEQEGDGPSRETTHRRLGTGCGGRRPARGGRV